MARYKYMHLCIADMPEDVIKHYNLRDKATPDGYVYCEIQKGMYGLPQAGIIAQQLLKELLKKHGYRQSQTTPGLWKHDTRPISFSLIVNDFGVKYVGEENVQHLLDTVRQYYKCLCDWEGEHYCGIAIKWDYEGWKVHLAMPGYLPKALTRLKHPSQAHCKTNRTPTSNPTLEPRHNIQRRRTHPPPLDKEGKRFIQEVCGTFLFYARAIDGGVLPALSALALQQAQPMENTMKLCKLFLITWHFRKRLSSPTKQVT